MPATKNNLNAEFLTAAQVLARYGGQNHMWLHRKIRDSNFPSAVRFGGKLRFFRLADVIAWEREIAARDYNLKPPRKAVRL